MNRLVWMWVAVIGGLVTTFNPATAAPGEAGHTGSSASPALTSLAREVLDTHPRVAAARAAVDAMRARADAAGRPLYNPVLEIEAIRGEDDEASVGLFQTFDWANKRGARAQTAADFRNAAVAELESVRQTIVTELLLALNGYQASLELDDLAVTRLELMESFADLAARRHASGDINRVELNVALLALAQARMQRARAAVALANAEQALAVLVVSRNGLEWPGLPTRPPAFEAQRVEYNGLLADLPSVRRQQAEVEAATSLVELRLREKKPDPTLSVRGGQENDTTLVGLSFSIPLFVRNTFSAEVVAAQAEQTLADDLLRDVQQRARARLMASADRYLAVRDAWASWAAAGQPSLDNQTKVLRLLWQAGELSTTDYLVQLQQALGTQASAYEFQQELWAAWFDWLAASGRVEDWAGTSR